MIDLKRANKMLNSLEFISGPSAENMWHHLVVEIERMRRPFDDFSMPSIAMPYAWRRAWNIYSALCNREAVPHDPDASEMRQAADHREWNEYLNCRAQFLEYVRRGDIDETTAQFLGLVPGDLGPVHSENSDDIMRGLDRHPEWRGRAFRISSALGAWEGMSKEQKAAIPQAMQTRRLAARVAELKSWHMQQMENAL